MGQDVKVRNHWCRLMSVSSANVALKSSQYGLFDVKTERENAASPFPKVPQRKEGMKDVNMRKHESSYSPGWSHSGGVYGGQANRQM